MALFAASLEQREYMVRTVVVPGEDVVDGVTVAVGSAAGVEVDPGVVVAVG